MHKEVGNRFGVLSLKLRSFLDVKVKKRRKRGKMEKKEKEEEEEEKNI